MTTKKHTQTATPGDLSTQAMLVKLQISRWGAKRNDGDVAEEVAKMKHSDAQLGRFTKQLLKSDALTAYKRKARECRRFHRLMTLPWDEGVGLLPAELYFKYTETISEKRREAEQYIEEFVTEYTAQWDNKLAGYKKSLGDLFNEADYPEPKDVRKKFGIRIRTYQIQDPNDFRVKMSGNTASGIKKQMQDDFSQDMTVAIRAPIIRLHECLTKVQGKLKNGEAIFRDSLIGNVRELVEILPALNVLNDPEINKLIKQTEKDICSVHDIKALRTDATYRHEVAKSAASILKSMKGYVS